MSRLDNRVAMVTGGASGIGRETCRVLADAGARVLVADIDDDRLGHGGGRRNHGRTARQAFRMTMVGPCSQEERWGV